MGKYADSHEEAFRRIQGILINWKTSFLLASEVIAEAKEREIWKGHYDSWHDFCVIGCGITKEWARQIMEARRTTKEISEYNASNDSKSSTTSDVSDRKSGKPKANELSPLTPRQADALKGLTTEQKAKVVKASQLVSPEISRKSLESARKTVEKVDKIIELDGEGYPIPEPALEFWNRKQEIQDLLTGISKMKGVLEKALESKDKMFGEVSLQRAIIDLNNAWKNVNLAKPYVVCTSCQGRLIEKCTLCKGRGLISKFAWDTIVPREIREIRIKSIKL